MVCPRGMRNGMHPERRLQILDGIHTVSIRSPTGPSWTRPHPVGGHLRLLIKLILQTEYYTRPNHINYIVDHFVVLLQDTNGTSIWYGHNDASGNERSRTFIASSIPQAPYSSATIYSTGDTIKGMELQSQSYPVLHPFTVPLYSLIHIRA